MAGPWGLAAAWAHLVALVQDARSPKPLLIATISAIASIRPTEAPTILGYLCWIRRRRNRGGRRGRRSGWLRRFP